MMENKQIWDPVRRKFVALTEEESVRQWFISVLNENLQCPLHLMNSEFELFFGDKKQKKYRADIIVYDRKGEALLVVECKKKECKIDDLVLNQALRYAKVLNVNYIILTNGKELFFFSKVKETFVQRHKLLTYNEMIEESNESRK